MGVVCWEKQINSVSFISRTCCKPDPRGAAAATHAAAFGARAGRRLRCRLLLYLKGLQLELS